MSISAGPDIVDSNLVLHLDAANSKSYSGTGDTWYDLSGISSNASLVNGTSYDSQNLGRFVFDGVNDYVDLGNENYVSTTQPFTIVQWLNINPRPITGTQSDFHRFFTLKSAGTSTFGVALITQIQFGYEGIYITNTNGWVRSKTSFYPTYNTWNQMCLTYNGQGSTNINNFKIYWNTNNLPFDSTDGFVPGLTADGNYLGSRVPSDVQIYRGSISNFSIYNRVLSATEIQQNFNALRSRYGI